MEIIIGLLIVAAWNIVGGVIDATDDRLGFSPLSQERSGPNPARRSANYSRKWATQDGGFQSTAFEAETRREPRLYYSNPLPRPQNIPTVVRLSR